MSAPLTPSRFSVIAQRARDVAMAPATVVDQIPDLRSPTLNNKEARCVLAAINTYQTDRPRQRVATITPPSPALYLYGLAGLVTGWSVDTHSIRAIQYPLTDTAGNATREPYFLDSNAWNETLDPATGLPAVRLCDQLTRPWALWWTEPYTLTISESNVPQRDEEAIAQLAAFHICSIVHSKACQFSDRSSLEGDGVDYKGLKDAFKVRKDDCKALYDEHISKVTPSAGPVFVDWDAESSWGVDLLMSPRWAR